MKRRWMAVILTLALVLGLSTTAGAQADRKERAAEALNRLSLFHGRSTQTKDYDLDSGLNRAEGTVLLLRLVGEEERANRYGPEDNRFEDMKKNRLSWAVPGVAYAHYHGLVKGISETEFNPEGAMSDYMFLTLVLRQLGYKDSNTAGQADFVWNAPYDLAYRVGLIDSPAADGQFTRGDAVLIAWKAMEVCFKDSEATLSDYLIEECTFSRREYRDARETYTYGGVIGEYDNAGKEELWQPEPGRKADAVGLVQTDRNGYVTEEVVLVGRNISVRIPEGVRLERGTTKLELFAGPMNEPGANLAVAGDETTESYIVSMEGISPENQVPIVVDLGPVLEADMEESYVQLYHWEQGEFVLMYEEFDLECMDQHNSFYYEIETGHLYVALATL